MSDGQFAAESVFQSLVARVRAGDERSFEKLLKAFAGPLYRLADSYIGNSLQSNIDADDLVQRVSLMLWNGLRSGKFVVRNPQQMLGLARIILKRQAAKAAKRHKLAMDAMAATFEGDLSATLADQCLIPDPAKKADANEQIVQLMKRVNADDRRMLELLLLGHTIAGAARLLKIEPAALRMRLSRLRVRIVKNARQPDQASAG